MWVWVTHAILPDIKEMRRAKKGYKENFKVTGSCYVAQTAKDVVLKTFQSYNAHDISRVIIWVGEASVALELIPIGTNTDFAVYRRIR